MRKQENRRARAFVLVTALIALVAGPVLAADSLFVCSPGVPYAYPGGGADIPWNPDLGDLGPLTNAQAVQAVSDAFDGWENVSTSSATFLQGAFLAVDIDVTNYAPIYSPAAPNGQSEIVFDADGSIFLDLFGPGSGILGFAGPDFGLDAPVCELTEGSAFLNGPEFADAIAAEDIMVHEFGHYINLGHVELNGQLIGFSEGGDTSGPTPDDTTFPVPADLSGLIETMYPFYFGTWAGTRTPHAEDIASISTIYPAASISDRGSISGTIYAANGTTRLSGVNVIARNLADPFVDAVSTFSGAYTNGTDQGDPNVGVYTLSNLTPGAEYAVFVDQVTAAAGRFSNPIIALPGPEEYWNADEANSNPPDSPLEYTAIVTVAGSPVAGTDIIFNQPSPGEPLPVGDDGFVQLALPFTYAICGQEYDSVFVNANGNLTFGSGDTDFTESASEMLSDQPRIAALWDDLSPFNLFTGAQQGLVTFYPSVNSFSVVFEDVPEFLTTGSNSFEITLKKSSDHVDIAYGDITSTDGLAGVSCGGAITSGFEAASDLTAFGKKRINLHNQPAIYEVWSGDNDASGKTFRFNGTTDYNDNWAEFNDVPRKARSLSLPFDSIPIPRFTEIEPAGGDIDWYRFNALGGTTLIAEIIGGQLDSLIALFASDGTLVAADDDGGAGLLSKIQEPIAADGTYYLAVTTFPDFLLTGAGGSGGRYVLDLFAIDGIVLDLGDDTSEEIALGFDFPFQGGSYSSVFVNSNGNLTFGSGDTDFSESVSELLSDQPRIAPLWDDLSPQNGGLVTVEYGAGAATVSFVDVPEFLTTGANNFAVTLSADGSYSIAYGGVTATDGIAGTTEGGFASDPGETDLSAGGPYPKAGTTYEVFGFSNPNDLSDASLVFDQ